MPDFTPNDVRILRELAKRIRDVAQTPRMEALREKWIAHNDFESDDPMVVIEIGSIMDGSILRDDMLECQGEAARSVEHGFRLKLHQAEVVKDDTVIDAEFRVSFKMWEEGWRKSIHTNVATDAQGRSLAHINQPLLTEPFDVSPLEHARFFVDRDATARSLSFWENLFGDLLNVRLRGGFRWSLGMTAEFLSIAGLEQFMLLPYDDPDAFHAIMQFLRDDLLIYIGFMEREGLLTLNNGNDYVGSGTYGYTAALPSPEFNGHVTPKDMWCLMESQESVNMSPSMFEEFIFPYQKELAELFGLCYYGCCEPVHNRLDILERIGNLRAISISPWCDMDFMAERIAGKYVFSRKPNPAWISTTRMEEALLREDARHMLRTTRGTPSALIMKDVHTLNGDGSRAAQWVQMMREEIARR